MVDFAKEQYDRDANIYTRNSSRMRYSERELYDDVVYALYEIQNKKKTKNIPQHR